MQFGYELYKLATKKMFYLFLAIVLVGNGVLFFTSRQDTFLTDEILPRYQEILAEYEGLSTEETIDRLREIEAKLDAYSQILGVSGILDEAQRQQQLDELQKQFPKEYDDYVKHPERVKALQQDEFVYRRLIQEANYIEGFDESIDNIKAQAEKMQQISIFGQKGTFSYNNIMKTPEDFAPLRSLPLSFGDSTGLTAASTFRITDGLLLLFSFFLCFLLFLQEKESGLFTLLRTAKNGRARLAGAKLLSAVLIVFIVSLICYGAIFLSASYVYGGFGDLSRYVQSMQAFSRCTIPMTVGQYIIVFLLSKAAAMLLITLLFAAVFSLSSSSGQAYVLIGGVVCINFITYLLIPPYSYLNLFKYMNFFELTDTYALYAQYQNINLFTLPVDRVLFSYGFSACLAVLSVAGIFLVFVKGIKLRGAAFLQKASDRIARLLARVRKSSRLFSHELFKLLIGGKAAVLLLAVILLTVYGLRQTELFLYTPEQVYVECANTLAGALNDQKIQYIQTERASLDAIGEEISALYEKAALGEISSQDAELQATLLRNRVQEKEEPLRVIEQQSAYLQTLKETRGITGAFVNERYTKEFFDRPESGQVTSILYIFLLIFAASYLVSYEYQTGMVRIVTAAKHGKRRLFFTKYAVLFLFAIVLWAVLYSRELIDMVRFFPIGDLNVPIQSMEQFSEIPVSMSIGTYLFCLYGLRLIGGLIVCAFTLSLSVFRIRRAFLILISSAVFLLPMLFEMLGLFSLLLFTANGLFCLNEISALPGGFFTAVAEAVVFALLCGAFGLVARRRFCNE